MRTIFALKNILQAGYFTLVVWLYSSDSLVDPEDPCSMAGVELSFSSPDKLPQSL